MENEELKKIIIKTLNAIRSNPVNTNLLVFSGIDQYRLEKFLVEAKEIAKSRQVKIAIDEDTRPFLPANIEQQISNSKIFCCNNKQLDFDELFSGVDSVIAGSLDLTCAAKTAGLIGDTFSTKIFSECFIRGIRVVAVDFTKEISAKSENYGKRIRQIKETLISFGVEFMPLDEIKLLNEETVSEITETEENNNIITEKLVQGFLGKELKITHNAVVTPLAKDAIREKKIKLIRGE